jgi:5-methyltetrahydrofolate--homocysteine methyltransferase
MKEVAPDAVLVAKSNAGIPFFENGRVHYPVAPEGMARHAALLRDIGSVRIIGGCCGNTPSHIAAICTELRTSRPHENDAHHTRSTQGGT